LPRADLLDLLTSLIDKSLIVADVRGAAARYHMLEPIRQYAAERLAASAKRASLEERHALYYVGLAERAEPELRTARQAHWSTRLDEELGNLRASLRWAADHGEPLLSQQLAGALWYFWRLRSNFSEGQRWLDEALALGAPDPSPVRARAIRGATNLAYASGNYERASELVETSLVVHHQLDDRWGLAFSW
jgi:predicted ATPase